MVLGDCPKMHSKWWFILECHFSTKDMYIASHLLILEHLTLGQEIRFVIYILILLSQFNNSHNTEEEWYSYLT